MTTAWPTTGASPWSLILRTSLFPTLATGAVCILIFFALDGVAGVAGAAMGMSLVIGFFGLGRLVLELMRATEAILYLIIALLTYGLQVVGLLALFAGFQRNPSWETRVSTTALGVTVIVCTLAWTTGLVVASRCERTPLYDLASDGR